MNWIHIKRTSMIEEQWILRHDRAPICCIKKNEGGWSASLLLTTGISTQTLHVHGGSLETAKSDAISELISMGWKLPTEKEAST